MCVPFWHCEHEVKRFFRPLRSHGKFFKCEPAQKEVKTVRCCDCGRERTYPVFHDYWY